MTGWKTILSAMVSILYGVGGMALGLHDASEMMGFVIAGIGMLGVGHKLDKNTAAVHENTEVAVAVGAGAGNAETLRPSISNN